MINCHSYTYFRKYRLENEGVPQAEVYGTANSTETRTFL